MEQKSKIRLFPLLFLLIILTGCSSALLSRDGDKLASQGEWDEAILKYREAFQKEPENIDYKIKYLKSKFEASQIHYNRGEEFLAKENHEAAMLEFQAALVLEPGFDKARTSLKKAKSQMDSVYYYGKGLDLMKKGEEKAAKNAFKKAVVLNPSNQLASTELEKLKKQQKVTIDGYELDLKSTAPITLEFRDAGLKSVFEVISKLAGINFVFDSEVRDERTSVFIKKASFQQALDMVLVTNKLNKKVVSENTIIIYPNTQQKSAQYEDTMIKVFYLTNTDAKKTMNLLKTMIKAKDITLQEDINAVIVRGRPGAIELAQKILDATDLADAEVVLDVSIMEINRNKASNLGIDLSPDSITAAVPTTNGTITARELLKGISPGDLLITMPSAILNIKKEDLDANILANPKIRVKNNGKAKIHVGERVPIITTTVNQGVTTENVQYQDVGLKLSVEPVVRQSDEIDLKLGLEVSSLGTKTVTTNGSIVYQIGTRNTDTMLRLHDGETQVFGGLINDEERKTVARIPFIGEVPVLGRLFSNVDQSKIKTEILLSITPRVIRKFEMPEEDITTFVSGVDDNPSTRPLVESISETSEPVLPGEMPGMQNAVPQPPPPPSPMMPMPGATPFPATLQPITQ